MVDVEQPLDFIAMAVFMIVLVAMLWKPGWGWVCRCCCPRGRLWTRHGTSSAPKQSRALPPTVPACCRADSDFLTFQFLANFSFCAFFVNLYSDLNLHHIIIFPHLPTEMPIVEKKIFATVRERTTHFFQYSLYCLFASNLILSALHCIPRANYHSAKSLSRADGAYAWILHHSRSPAPSWNYVCSTRQDLADLISCFVFIYCCQLKIRENPL